MSTKIPTLIYWVVISPIFFLLPLNFLCVFNPLLSKVFAKLPLKNTEADFCKRIHWAALSTMCFFFQSFFESTDYSGIKSSKTFLFLRKQQLACHTLHETGLCNILFISHSSAWVKSRRQTWGPRGDWCHLSFKGAWRKISLVYGLEHSFLNTMEFCTKISTWRCKKFYQELFKNSF